MAQGDIIVLSDANTMIVPEAIQALVRHFEVRDVGAVCGKLRL
jgi:cellulose synthase/poly-beta-1,6-N-acetylglucosamine synthase-like glycosyltransferase